MAKTTNVGSARKALQAQLANFERGIKYHQQGVAYYEHCVAQVHAALQALEPVETADAVTRSSGKRPAAFKAPRGARPKVSTKPAGQKVRQARRERRPASSDVPATGNAFWLKQLRKDGRTLDKILERAVKALSKQGFVAGPEALKVLRSRAAAALHVLVKQNAVSDEGGGRARTYRLP